MSLPYVDIGGKKVAPFKFFESFYGPFINTTPAGVYSTQQDITIHGVQLHYTWPSTEQAYHARKILHLKQKLSATDPRQGLLTQALDEIQNVTQPGDTFLPAQYTTIVDNLIQKALHLHPSLGRIKKDFDKLCDADFHKTANPTGGIDPATRQPYTLGFMRDVVRLKLEQYPQLAAMAMQLAREGILLMEISTKDVNWASGSDGDGLNMLGILLLEEGNRLLLARGEPVVISNPAVYYHQLQSQFQSSIAYSTIAPYEQKMGSSFDPQQSTHRQIAQSNSAVGYWVTNYNNTKAAFIQNGMVITGVFKSAQGWAKGGDLTKFNDLLQYRASSTFEATLTGTNSAWVYNNPNPQLATKAALCQNGIVLTGIYKGKGSNQWQQSGRLADFNALIPAQPPVKASSVGHAGQKSTEGGLSVGIKSAYWVINLNGTKAAFIQNGQVITGVYKTTQGWRKSDDLSKFSDMLTYPASSAFQTSTTAMQVTWIYNNSNPQLATKAALCENGVIITGVFKRPGQSEWEQSGDLSRLKSLVPAQQTASSHTVSNPPLKTGTVAMGNPAGRTLNGSTSSALQKKQLIERLRLNSTNHNDLKFWEKQVKVGGSSYKGHTIPHSIVKALVYIENNKELPYGSFKKGLEDILKEKSNSLSSLLGLQGIFRSKAVSELRQKAEEGTLENHTPGNKK